MHTGSTKSAPFDLGISKSNGELRLPKRDWLLLPAISLVTLAALLGSSEVVARVLYPAAIGDSCYVQGAGTDARFRPNCKSRSKTAEGPWVDNSYNECGYRTRESCASKPPGTLRVAVLGSSFSYGFMTPYDTAYTTVAGQLLAKQCRRPVEFQNLGVYGIGMLDVYHRTDEALALKPDVLLLAFSAFDLIPEISPDKMAQRDNLIPGTLKHQNRPDPGSWIKNFIVTPLKESRAITMLQHFMYQNPETYTNLFMYYGDNADYVRTPLSQRWRQRFSNLDVLIEGIHKRADAASVPMVVLVGAMPSQVALVNSPLRSGVDPYVFGTEVTQIASKYNVLTVNPLPDFANRPDAMALVYPVDGHVAPQGQKVVAEELSRRILSSGLAAFSESNKTE